MADGKLKSPTKIKSTKFLKKIYKNLIYLYRNY